MYATRGSCRSSSIAGCILIASAGGIALLSLIIDPIISVIYTITVLSLGLTLYNIPENGLSLFISLSTMLIILLSQYYNDIIILTVVFYSTLLFILYKTRRMELSLTYWPVILIPVYSYGGISWLPLYAASVVATSAILSYLESRRGHVFMLLAVVPVVAMVDPLLSVAASASALALSVVLAGIVERSGCPFTQDSGLVFVGVGVSLVSVIMALINGPWSGYWLTLWITGFLFIEAGALVPQELGRNGVS